MADYKKLSESTFNMQAKTYDTDKNGKHARTLYQHVINQLETIKFDNLLDVGCGTGEILTTVKRLYPNTSMYGLDFEPLHIVTHSYILLDFPCKIKVSALHPITYHFKNLM